MKFRWYFVQFYGIAPCAEVHLELLKRPTGYG